jgi:hypothetical protein
LAEAKAAKTIMGMELEPVTDPVAALRELAAETLALKAVLLQRVAALQGELRYEGRAGQEQTRAELSAYEHAAERAGRLLTDLARLGLDSRRVQIEEAQILILVAVVSRGLSAANLPDDLRESARASIANEMRLIEAGNG